MLDALQAWQPAALSAAHVACVQHTSAAAVDLTVPGSQPRAGPLSMSWQPTLEEHHCAVVLHNTAGVKSGPRPSGSPDCAVCGQPVGVRPPW